MILPLVLAMWAAGLAGAAAIVAWWRVVGPGFLWLAGGVTALLGTLAAASGGGPAAWAGTLAALAAVGLARRATWAGTALALGALAYLLSALSLGGWPALTGSLLLGGVTGGLVLGHWYLVDPRLPRWAIRWLAGGALAGVLSDAASLAMGGALASFAEESVIAWAFLALAVLTVVLLIGVWLSLREPSYSGVMAATGLSYLAVLTALGAAVAGRLLVGL